MSPLESALLQSVTGHDFEDALASLAAVQARLQAKMLGAQVRPATIASPSHKLLAAKEVAKLLGLSVKTVYQRKRELGAVRIGRAVRFDAETVRRVIEG